VRDTEVGRPPLAAADPWSAWSDFAETRLDSEPLLYAMLYRRRLPHVWNSDQPVFLTWRLHGSLPPHRWFAGGTLPSGKAFVALDRVLDEARTGPFYLRQPALADMVVEAISYNARILKHYVLHAFVVMPNHVHLLVTAEVPLPPTDEVAERHYGQTGQCDVGIGGKTLLAGRES